MYRKSELESAAERIRAIFDEADDDEEAESELTAIIAKQAKRWIALDSVRSHSAESCAELATGADAHRLLA